MEYLVQFYRTSEGISPLVEFLEELRARNQVLHKLVVAGIKKLEHRSKHGMPLTRSLAGTDGILEVRVGDRDIARVFFFFFFQPGEVIVCTHGYVKKSDKADPGEIDRAQKLKVDWERRQHKE